MSTNARIKKENWSAEEIEVLLEEVEKRKSFLFGKLSAFVTNARKKAHWGHVVDAINAISKTTRTEAEATKKWRSIKSKTKTKEGERQQEMKKTGGGESAAAGDPSPIEQRVLSIIGQTCVRGIPEGVDSGVAEATCNNLEDTEDDALSQPPVRKERSRKHVAHQLTLPSTPERVISEADSPVGDNDVADSAPPARNKKRKRPATVSQASERLVEIESQRLQIEKERLAVEKERLQIEKKRFECEEKRLEIEKHKYTTTTAQSAIDNIECTYMNL